MTELTEIVTEMHEDGTLKGFSEAVAQEGRHDQAGVNQSLQRRLSRPGDSVDRARAFPKRRVR